MDFSEPGRLISVAKSDKTATGFLLLTFTKLKNMKKFALLFKALIMAVLGVCGFGGSDRTHWRAMDSFIV